MSVKRKRNIVNGQSRIRTHRFYDLYHLLHHEDWLRTAQAHVKRNAGSQTAGCDGVNMRVFEEDLGGNLRDSERPQGGEI